MEWIYFVIYQRLTKPNKVSTKKYFLFYLDCILLCNHNTTTSLPKVLGGRTLITESTALAMLTVGQLKEIVRDLIDEKAEKPSTERRYVYGLQGIRQLFGVGLNTAQKYKDGIIKDAVIQIGRKIIVDADKAIELMQQHCANK